MRRLRRVVADWKLVFAGNAFLPPGTSPTVEDRARVARESFERELEHGLWHVNTGHSVYLVDFEAGHLLTTWGSVRTPAAVLRRQAERSPDIADLVAADVAARKLAGIPAYGVPLRANNGRKALVDAYEECLDMCMYLKQRIVEDDSK